MMIFLLWPGPKFLALLTTDFWTHCHHSPLAGQVPNFCASCVSEECLVTRSQAHKPKYPADLWNCLEVKLGISCFRKRWFFACGKQSHGVVHCSVYCLPRNALECTRSTYFENGVRWSILRRKKNKTGTNPSLFTNPFAHLFFIPDKRF